MDKYILHIYTDMGERAGKGLKRTAQIKIINNNNKALSAAVNSLLTDALSAAAAAHSLSLSLSLAGERTTRDAKSMRLCASERARKFNVWLGFFCRIFFFCRGAASNTYTRTHAHL